MFDEEDYYLPDEEEKVYIDEEGHEIPLKNDDQDEISDNADINPADDFID